MALFPAGGGGKKRRGRLDRGGLGVCAPKHAAGAEAAGRRRIEVTQAATQAAHTAPGAGGAWVGNGGA